MGERRMVAFAGLVDLADATLGGQALSTSDDFFAPMDNLVRRGRATFDPDRYTDHGKWMDGWESRRRRSPGHDWCVVRLGVPGVIRAVDIDTDHFLGNHAPFASVWGCNTDPNASAEDLVGATWVEVVPSTPLDRGSRNLCAATCDGVFTHVRLDIYPDGGVARLRVFGEPRPPPAAPLTTPLTTQERIDLASVRHGGQAVVCTDAFFSPMGNLVAPGRSTFMGGGWETRRSRPPGSDFIVVRLGTPGVVEEIVLETHHFQGNYPDRASVEGLYWPDAPAHVLAEAFPHWREVVPPTKMRADTAHTFAVPPGGALTHLRLRIVPDGGISRLRAFGRPSDRAPGADLPWLAALSALPDDPLAEILARCCGSTRWVTAMLHARPFGSPAQLFGTARQIWWHLDEADWREAFTHHPVIGADVEALRERFAATAARSEAEQAGVQGADPEVLQALANGNRAYQDRFGHIFIVCASGLTAAEMLARLEDRLDNVPEVEIRHGAGAQADITELRLAALEDT